MIGLIILAAAQTAIGPNIENNRVPKEATISKIENEIVMPEGADKLSNYYRSYTEAKIDGRDMVIGQMIGRQLEEVIARGRHQSPPPPVRRVLMNDILPAFDGGCGILTVIYDVAANTAPKVACNPVGPH